LSNSCIILLVENINICFVTYMTILRFVVRKVLWLVSQFRCRSRFMQLPHRVVWLPSLQTASMAGFYINVGTEHSRAIIRMKLWTTQFVQIVINTCLIVPVFCWTWLKRNIVFCVSWCGEYNHLFTKFQLHLLVPVYLLLNALPISCKRISLLAILIIIKQLTLLLFTRKPGVFPSCHCAYILCFK